jgi:hypothetical protein
VTPAEYDALSIDERYTVLHEVYEVALDVLVQDDFELPTPGQVSHCDFAHLNRALQVAIKAKT